MSVWTRILAWLRRRPLIAGGSFQLQTGPARQVRRFALQQAPPARERRLPAVLISLHRQRIEQLLAQRQYDAADRYYRLVRHCYAQSAYTALRRAYWEQHRAEVLHEMDALLAQYDFRRANALVERSRVVVTQEEYLSRKADAVRRYFQERYKVAVNDEQAAAMVCPAQHVLVKARAGTGKTNTIVSKAILAITEEGLHPDQVLLLAFNRAAAREMLERMRRQFALPEFTTAKTFHSLAYRLVNPSRKILSDDGEQLELVEMALDNVWTPSFRKLVNAFFRVAGNTTPPAFTVKLLSLSGDRVKSTGEKWIADFLFEHGIRFKYEQVFWWSNGNIKSPYRPDFTLFDPAQPYKKIAILEHWGVSAKDPNAAVLFDGMTAGQYRLQMAAKRGYWRSQGIPLIETSVDDLQMKREQFEALLKQRLEALGIRCERLPDAELEKMVKPRYWNELTRLMNQFIQRAKNRRMSPDEAKRIWRTVRKGSLRTRLFWRLAARIYAEYERLLNQEQLMDFQDLLAEAAQRVDEAQGNLAFIPEPDKKPVQLQDLRWLLIDEYQDFSPGFDHLVKTMRKYNPKLRLFCVGDDWQTINRFAGSEPFFFRNFAAHLENAAQALLRINHRSPQVIVETSNRFMQGQGEPASWLPDKLGGQVFITCVDQLYLPDHLLPQVNGAAKANGAADIDIPDEMDLEDEPDELDGNPANNGRSKAPPFDNGFMRAKSLAICTSLIQDFVSRPGPKPTVAILSRTNFIHRQQLFDFQKELLKRLPAALADSVDIEVTTIHKYKGKQANLVILMDITAGQMPLLHKDNELFAPFLPQDADPLKEAMIDERRLFYVALSRATEQLWILTEGGRESPFLQELGAPVVPPPVIPSPPVPASATEF